MNFTGNNLSAFRDFYTQNDNFEVNIDFSVDNTSSKYEFGVTGTSKLGFLLESGRMTYNNIFLHNYLPNRQYNVKMEVSRSGLNVLMM